MMKISLKTSSSERRFIYLKEIRMLEICLQNVFRHYKNLNLHVTTMEAVHLSHDTMSMGE